MRRERRRLKMIDDVKRGGYKRITKKEWDNTSSWGFEAKRFHNVVTSTDHARTNH